MISLLTDFQDSEYAGVIKGVIYSIAPEAKVVDLTHKIRAFDVRYGAYAVYSSCRFFPDNTIFLAVVDPGVGTERKGVIIKSRIEGRTYYFIGPNNGLFSLIEAEKVYEISSKIKEFRPKNMSTISKTFHARDIFAPAAAMLELGSIPEQFGKEMSKARIKKIIKKAKVKKNAIEGELITYDCFGNIITNIKAEQMSKEGIKYGEKLKVKINKIKRKIELKFLETYGYAKEKEILCLINSAGHLEIAQKNGSAAKVLKVKGGEKILVSM